MVAVWKSYLIAQDWIIPLVIFVRCIEIQLYKKYNLSSVTTFKYDLLIRTSYGLIRIQLC